MKRYAFTLMELLVVIVIIGMLASLSLAALWTAQGSAKEAATKATIAKLDAIIQDRYADFFTRRLPIVSGKIPPDAMAELKVRTLREIMRMEMPDRVRDITWPRDSGSTDPLTVVPSDIDAQVRLLASFASPDKMSQYWVNIQGNVWISAPPTTPPNWPKGITRTSLARRYFRRVQPTWSLMYDSAECLYMIVASDPAEREHFRENEVGDADGDGFPEFQDAWGHPIMFLRWAPGFQSELQTCDVSNDFDPTNQRRIGDLAQDSSGKFTRVANNISFRLAPLIYSAGRDGKYGINQKSDWTVEFSRGDSVNKVWTDGADIGEPVPLGHDEFDSHLDNITNHIVGMN